jgi:hypothetical protein
LDAFAASIKAQSSLVVSESGGTLQDVRATCTDVLPVGRRRNVLQTSGAVVIKTVYVIVPKASSGFTPTVSEVLSGNLKVQVIDSREALLIALDEGSELQRVDLVQVSHAPHSWAHHMFSPTANGYVDTVLTGYVWTIIPHCFASPSM